MFFTHWLWWWFFFSCSRNRKYSVESFTADTCSAHQSSVLWFLSRSYHYCSPHPGSLTVGIEPASPKWGTEIWGWCTFCGAWGKDSGQDPRTLLCVSRVQDPGVPQSLWHHGCTHALPGTKCWAVAANRHAWENPWCPQVTPVQGLRWRL